MKMTLSYKKLKYIFTNESRLRKTLQKEVRHILEKEGKTVTMP